MAKSKFEDPYESDSAKKATVASAANLGVLPTLLSDIGRVVYLPRPFRKEQTCFSSRCPKFSWLDEVFAQMARQ